MHKYKFGGAVRFSVCKLLPVVVCVDALEQVMTDQ